MKRISMNATLTACAKKSSEKRETSARAATPRASQQIKAPKKEALPKKEMIPKWEASAALPQTPAIQENAPAPSAPTVRTRRPTSPDVQRFRLPQQAFAAQMPQSAAPTDAPALQKPFLPKRPDEAVFFSFDEMPDMRLFLKRPSAQVPSVQATSAKPQPMQTEASQVRLPPDMKPVPIQRLRPYNALKSVREEQDAIVSRLNKKPTR